MTTFLQTALQRGGALLLLAWLAPAAGLAWEAGLAPATHKLLPGDPVPAARSLELFAAGGEWEALQLAVRHDAPLRGVDAWVSDLTGPGGASLPAAQARLYRLRYVEVTTGSLSTLDARPRAPGRYPDPLVPFRDPYAPGGPSLGAPFELPAGELGLVFIDWRVPAGTPPGSYQGMLHVSAEGQPDLALEFTLQVWEFDLPAERTVATAFGLSEGALRAFHGGPGPAPAPGFQDIVARYHDALHEHRLDPTSLHAPLEFHIDADGELLPVDFTAHDATLEPWLTGSRFADGQGVLAFDLARFTPGRGLGGFTERQYRQAARAFAEHLEARGWWSRAYVYAVDEPWSASTHGDPDRVFAAIAEDAARLVEASPLWRGKTLITGPYDPRAGDGIGIWCPDTVMYADWFYTWEPKPGRETYAERLALGERLWFYVCNQNVPPYAGYDIDATLGFEPRIVKWGAWLEQASGFLYWSANYWPQNDPWNTLLDLETFGRTGARNGDGFLLYPGDHDGSAAGLGSPPGVALDGPIPSYRLKQVRDGLEDWELFALASAEGAEDYVRAQVARAHARFGAFPFQDCGDPAYFCPDAPPWSPDPDLLAEVRRNVAAKLLHLRFPERYPDPEAGPVVEPGEETGCGCGAGPGPVGGGLALLLAGLASLARLACARRPTPRHTAAYALGLLAWLAPWAAPGQEARPPDGRAVQARIDRDVAADRPIVVHVVVALADNAHQGIVPVPARLGDGRDPHGNLYWGARYGVRTFFTRQAGWKAVPLPRPADARVLERLAFRGRVPRRGARATVVLVAEAWDGAAMRPAVDRFLGLAAGAPAEELDLPGEPAPLRTAGGAHLVVFIGHNGLMDFDLPASPEPRRRAEPASALVLACASRAYFQEHLEAAGCHPLLLTTGLMAPEAYTLEAALRTWVGGGSVAETREAAGSAYHAYQKCGLGPARRLFWGAEP
jgi:hypothetical protein